MQSSVDSATDVTNLALSHLSAARITDLNDGTQANAVLAKIQYKPALIELLRMAPWAHASTRANLPQSETPPAFGFSYAYPLPSDWVWTIAFNDIDPECQSSEIYRVESGAILSDSSTGKLHYVYYHETPSGWPADFVEAFSVLLAQKLAMPITHNAGIQQSMQARFETISLPRSASHDGNDSQLRRSWTYDSDLVKARSHTSAR